MAKKKLRKKVQRKPAGSANKFGAPVVDSAREIWLAGLGAFSVAQKEGEKVLEQGTKFFDKLVSEGSKLEKSTRKDVEGAVKDFEGAVKDFRGEVESRVGDLRGEVESRVEEVRQQAETVRKQAFGNWDKLEDIFENRVARALSSLGIPSKDDVDGLSERVQKLSRQVAALDKKTVAAKPRAVKKPAAKKAAPKKAAMKKAPPKKAALKKAAPKKAAVKKAEPKDTPKAA
jgi:poly(hydroxyalkanoate) granule-associated protein